MDAIKGKNLPFLGMMMMMSPPKSKYKQLLSFFCSQAINKCSPEHGTLGMCSLLKSTQ